MTKLSNNFKYIIFSFVLIVVGFSFSHSASAYTYVTYSNSCIVQYSGPTMSVVALSTDPNSLTAVPASSTMTAYAYVINYCPVAVTVNLTFQNNGGPIIPLITNAIVSPNGTYPNIPTDYSFKAPATAGTSYAGHFNTNTTAVGAQVWSNTPQTSPWVQKNNCASGFEGTFGSYTVGSGYYTSTISQADADSQAYNFALSNMQSYVNSYGRCGFKISPAHFIPGSGNSTPGYPPDYSVCYTNSSPLYVAYSGTNIRYGGYTVYDNSGYGGEMGNPISGTVVGIDNGRQTIMTIQNGMVNYVYQNCP